MKKTVSFYTLGCKVNQYETNAMEQQFIKNNYEIVENTQKADIYVINTCTVTNMAERKSRQMLRRVKEINPSAVLVVCGCYAQVAKNELEQIPEIDIILGINEKNEIVQIVENYMEKMAEQNKKSQEAEIDDVSKQKEFLDFGDVTYTEKTRAVIKIQDGCDRFCSYCIIPYARGRVRSRKPESVIEEISKIAENGIKEVVVTGIHVASYGKDFKEEYGLIDLLEEINKIDGIERIRLGSIEPMLIKDEFVTRLTKLEKICHHFHLSLQSGCTETLKRMNRRYSAEEFEEVTERLRQAYDDVILTTDIIVGFPNETDEEFEQTFEFLKRIKFYKMHVFKYSPRKGTKAAVMPNQIDGNVKEERSKRLIELSDKNEKEKYINKKVKVLFEDEHIENGNKYIKGHTANYIMVKVPIEKENEDYSNRIENVQIIKNDNMELIGKII